MNMKGFGELVISHSNRELNYATIHMNDNLSQFFPITPDLETDSTHYFIFDMKGDVNLKINQYIEYRKQGIKVILMVFDPVNFPLVRVLIDYDCLDKIILFDLKFKEKFSKGNFYVTDYFFNSNYFPKIDRETPKKYPNKVCVFGHLNHGRYNNFDCKWLDSQNSFIVNSYKELYDEVQQYNGVSIHDTGYDEDRTTLTNYNKAKAVESLMCGVNSYCKEGINTKRYNRFLKKYEDIPNIKEVDFLQEDIMKINDLTIKELLYECEFI